MVPKAERNSNDGASLAGDRIRRSIAAAGLLALLLGSPICLIALAGPPHLPAQWPSWLEVEVVLQGPELPLAALAYIASSVAWLVWAWLAFSVTLQVAALIAETVSSGRWVGPLRATADRVTAPVVRQLVEWLFVALFVVQLAGRVPAVEAQTASQPVAAAVQPGPAGAAPTGPVEQQQDSSAVDYTVQSGDTVWGIAERFYDTGWEFQRVVTANTGRKMADGRRFTDAGHIYPGWVLRVTLPSTTVDELDGQTFYTVEPGDTLSGIAARLLGDENRWHDIFELNDGVAKVDGGRVLHRANLIWPGLRLKLPLATAKPAPPAPAPSALAPTEQLPSSSPSPTESATPLATPTAAEPVATSATIAPSRTSAMPSPMALGAGGLGAVAAAAGVLGLARKRFRRSMDEPPIHIEPESDVVIEEGFAQADVARAFSHRAGGTEVEPVVLVAQEALRVFAGEKADALSVVLARHGRSGMTLLLSAEMPEQDRILANAANFASVIGGSVQAKLSADRDVELRVSGLKLSRLINLAERPNSADRLLLLPLGVLGNRELLDANWHELGHVLVAGDPGGGAETVLTSMIAGLAGRVSPDELQLVMVAAPRSIPDRLRELPHLRQPSIEATDAAALSAAIEPVRDEVVRRMRQAGGSDVGAPDRQPAIVVVLAELSDVPGGDTSLQLIASEGPAVGVRLLAATTNSEALGSAELAHFGTRVVLRMSDEDQSMRLVGRPDASLLDRGGDMLVRIQGRDLVQVRGYRLTPDHLDQLVELMSEAFGGKAPVAEPHYDAPAITYQEPPEIPENGPSERVVEDVAPPEIAPLVGPNEAEASANPDAAEVAQLVMDVAEPDVLAEGEREAESSAVQPPSPPGIAAVMQRVRAGMSALGEPAADTADSARGGARGSGVEVVDPSTRRLQVYCFGGLRVTAGEQQLSPRGADGYKQYKPWELLAFLAAQRQEPVARLQVLSALWPNTDEAHGLESLTSATTRLRGVIGGQVAELKSELVCRDRDGSAHLDGTAVWSDVRQFLQLSKDGRHSSSAKAKVACEQARSLYAGDLLAGTSYKWVHERSGGALTLQEEYREEYRTVTKRLATLYCDEDRPDLAVTIYRGLLDQEPILEDIVRRLYRCHQLLGDRGAIMREHQQLRDNLRKAFSDPDDPRDETGSDLYEPSAETNAAYAEAMAELDVRVRSASA